MTNTSANFITDVWNNPSKLDEFRNDPKKYLLSIGENIPTDAEVVAHIDTNSDRNFVLPESDSILPSGDNYILNIIRKALKDASFKNQLLNNTASALAANNLRVPDGVNIHVYENQKNLFHVVVPFNPASGELSDTDLESVAGGGQTLDNCGYGSGGTSTACAIATFFSIGTSALVSGVAAGTTAIASVIADPGT